MISPPVCACRISARFPDDCARRQLIFRKVSDVKREQELAERRKNDPSPDISQDHLVRKIFSRFKKSGDHSNSQQGLRSGRTSQGVSYRALINA